MEDLAARGRLGAETLHRLATVLDALDIDVPIADLGCGQPNAAARRAATCRRPASWPTWRSRREAQRRRPHHPARHAHAGSRRARTAPTCWRSAMRSGRSKRIGLEADARRLGLEALLPVWPRAAGQLTRRGAMTIAAACSGGTRGLPRDARGRARRSAEYAAGLPARPRGLSRLPRARGTAASGCRHRPRSAPICGAVGGRPGAGLAGAAAVGDPPALQVPGGRGRDRRGPGARVCRPEESPRAAQDAVGRRGRPPDRGRAPPHRGRTRAATTCGRCACTP